MRNYNAAENADHRPQFSKPIRAGKKFVFEFSLSGDLEKDKRLLLLNFQKAVDAYFNGRPKRDSYTGPERY